MKMPYKILFREHLGGDEENVRGFKEAGDVLVGFVVAGEKYSWHEAFLRPILLLYRHYLELEMKYWMNILKGRGSERGHSLAALWSGLRPLIEPFCTGKEEQEVLARVQQAICEFDHFDPTGQESRYTTTTKGKATLEQVPERIDVEKLKNHLGEVYTFFVGLAAVTTQGE